MGIRATPKRRIPQDRTFDSVEADRTSSRLDSLQANHQCLSACRVELSKTN